MMINWNQRFARKAVKVDAYMLAAQIEQYGGEE